MIEVFIDTMPWGWVGLVVGILVFLKFVFPRLGRFLRWMLTGQ